MGNVGVDFSVWQVIAWIGMAVSSWFSLTCAYSGWDFFSRRRREDAPSPDWTPAVTILKPLKGLDPQLYENLSTFCCQDYPRLQRSAGCSRCSRCTTETAGSISS